MRLRNRSHHQIAEVIAFMLGLPRTYRCTAWQVTDDTWCYLDIQPSPTGDDYTSLTQWLASRTIKVDAVHAVGAMRRFELTPANAPSCFKPAAISTMVLAMELERFGATERDVDRVVSLEPGQAFEPHDKAFKVRRLV